MNVRTTLIGAVAVIAMAFASSVQAGIPSGDAHDRQADVATLQDAHDRIGGQSRGVWSASGTRGVDTPPAVGRYTDHPGAVSQRPTVIASPGGFDWRDAAIGAVSGMGFALLLGGLALLTIGQRRGTRVAMR